MGMMNWIIENQRYDARYLANANQAAAKADGEPTWTQTAWLVKINPDGTPGPFLRGSDLGLAKEKRPKKKGDGDWEFDSFLVYTGGAPKPFDPNSETDPVEGDLLVDTEIKGIKVKSVLQILREAVAARKLSEWAKLAGLEEADLVDLAREFTSHGKKAVADIHRGVSQHTSGFYNVLTYMTLNASDRQSRLARRPVQGHHLGHHGRQGRQTLQPDEAERQDQTLRHLHHPARDPV